MLQRLRENKSAQGTLLVLPTTIWLVGLLVIPLILTLIISFGKRGPDGDVIYAFSLDNYIRLATDPLYLGILWRSISLAFNTTALVITLAYPLAYFIARAQPKKRNTYLFMVLIPLWTNFVIRFNSRSVSWSRNGVIPLPPSEICL